MGACPFLSSRGSQKILPSLAQALVQITSFVCWIWSASGSSSHCWVAVLKRQRPPSVPTKRWYLSKTGVAKKSISQSFFFCGGNTVKAFSGGAFLSYRHKPPCVHTQVRPKLSFTKSYTKLLGS